MSQITISTQLVPALSSSTKLAPIVGLSQIDDNFSTSASLTSSSRNWDEDPDDDFDYDKWKANADTSAPTLDSLPALQQPLDDDDNEPILITIHNEAAPWAEPAREPVAKSRLEEVEANWRCGKTFVAWVMLQKTEQAGKPAYVEMSRWENGALCPDKRVNYAQTWSNTKTASGFDSRSSMHWRRSPLYQVTVSEETLENGEERQDATSGAEKENKLKAQKIPTTNNNDTKTADVSTRSSSSTSAVSKELSREDEGYSSASTSPTTTSLPTAPLSDDIASLESLDGLKTDENVKNEQGGFSKTQQTFRTTASSLSLGDDKCSSTMEASLEDTMETSSMAAYVADAAAKSWLYVSSNPWTTASVLTVGVILGGALHLTRRR